MKEKYQELLNEIEKNKDIKYQEFSSVIAASKVPMIGVRIPILREIAKKNKNINLDEFIKFYKGNTFEERMLFGLLIAYSNNIEIYDKYLPIYAKEIVDWSLCDSVATSLKLIRKDNEHFYKMVIDFINSKEEFIIRFGIIILFDHYLNDKYVDKVIEELIRIKSDKYYVNMAIAWLLCELYIKYPNKIDKYLNSNYFDKFVLNKAISKINDSYRIDKKVKEMLKERRTR